MSMSVPENKKSCYFIHFMPPRKMRDTATLLLLLGMAYFKFVCVFLVYGPKRYRSYGLFSSRVSQ